MFLFAVFVTVLFLLFGLFVPVRLTIEDVPDPFYADIHLDSTTASVEYVSLFGLHFPAKDVYGTQSATGDVQVWSRGLSYRHSYDVVMPVETKVTYHGDGAYVGQTANKDDFSVVAVYEDGEREVEWFEISQDVIPLASEVKLPVKLMYGVTTVDLKTIQPAKVTAIYDETCQMGDTFEKDKVRVTLVYSDKTEYEISDFRIPDAPKYLSDDTLVNVITDYGNVSFHIVPENAAKLSATYTTPVYVGDVLDKTHVELKVGDTVISPSEFEIDDIGVIKTKAKVLVSSKYGNVMLTIEPFTVKSCKIVTSDALVEETVPLVESVTLTFSNDTTREVSLDECQFLNTAKPLEAGMTDLWFEYKDLRLYGTVFVVSEDIASLRVNDSNIGENPVTYDLTDDQIRKLAIVCQRLASTDLAWVGYEASLMANRYELYGTDADVWEYVLNSGYWGADLEDYIIGRKTDDKAMQVVRDVLCNGYRRVPLFVDSRCEFVTTDILQNGDYIQDRSGNTYMFYVASATDSSWVYCCTETAYRNVTGEVFRIGDVLQSSNMLTSDGTLVIDEEESTEDSE